MDVRGDQEHPGEQAEADRQDQRVDHAGRVALRVTAPDEEEQPRHQRRVHGEVEPVADRREADVGAGQDPVAVRVEVAREEQELAQDEEQPGGAGLWSVQVDPDRDRDGRGQAEQVDQRAARLEGREPEVGER